MVTDIIFIKCLLVKQNEFSLHQLVGNKYWVYDGNYFVENSPRSITDYGFDVDVPKIDAAFVWSKNGKTYLFAGKKFIRYDEQTKQMDENYPADIIEKWHGIPNNLDAVTSVPSGKTYFFKGNLYWLFNNKRIRPERSYPRRTSTALLDCSLQSEDISEVNRDQHDNS